jgi:hypothetical protein
MLKECNSGFGIGDAEHGMQEFHFVLLPLDSIHRYKCTVRRRP